jgi:hypothetical protein
VWEGGCEGEGHYGATTTVALSTATEGDSALGQIYGSVLARRSFEVANATLNALRETIINHQHHHQHYHIRILFGTF